MPLKLRGRRAIGVSLVAWTLSMGTAAGAWQTTTATPPPPAAAPRPASSGVYTDAQAARGRRLYADNCQGCHNTGSQSGEAFAKKWRGAALSDLFRVLTDDMPKDAPGSLAPQERVDIIAYVLKLNALAAGNDELPADVAQLKTIVIDLPGGREKN